MSKRWHVGQAVGVHNFVQRRVEPAAIVRLGRKWGVLDSGLRFNLETGYIGGGRYLLQGEVYPSEAEAKEKVADIKLTIAVRRAMGRSDVLERLTSEQLRTLAGWLGVPVTPAEGQG